jgi:hypothetical protein
MGMRRSYASPRSPAILLTRGMPSKVPESAMGSDSSLLSVFDLVWGVFGSCGILATLDLGTIWASEKWNGPHTVLLKSA